MHVVINPNSSVSTNANPNAMAAEIAITGIAALMLINAYCISPMTIPFCIFF